jgi:hypothetical protein
MTIEAHTPLLTHIVAGIGPYAVSWPYAAGSLEISVVTSEGLVVLEPSDYTVAPDGTTTTGNVYLSGAVAAAYDGDFLRVERKTEDQQGWQAVLGERERGLEAQLDSLTMGLQEVRRAANGALRLDVPTAPITLLPGASLVMNEGGFGPGPTIDQIAAAGSSANAAAASALAASNSADAASSAAQSALVSLAGAQDAAQEALAAEAETLAARDAAVFAAQASGDILFYNTKANALAALAGLAEGQNVEVFFDESLSGRRVRYRVESAALVVKILFDQARVFFVSPNGNDANDGLSPATAFATCAKAASVAVAGNTVRLARGGIWREAAPFVSGVSVEAFGNGLRPIISGQDVVSTFTQHEAGPAYSFTITLPEGSADRAYPGVWQGGRRMTEIKVGDPGIATTAAAIAAVAATPDTFYFAGPGSYSAGWSAGAKTYYIHASGSSNPNSNGLLYEAYARAYAASGAAFYRNIRLHSGFHHDGMSAALEGCTIERLARHGNLPAIPQYKDVLVIGNNPAYAGGGFFHSNPGSLQPDAVYERCTVVGETRNATGFYQHGQTAGVHRRNVARLLDCEAYNMALCIGFDEVALVEVDNFRARNFDALVGVSSNGAVNMRGVDAKGGTGGSGDGGRLLSSSSPGALTIRDSKIDYHAQSLFFTSGGFGPVEIYNTDLVLRCDAISGSGMFLAWANNTNLSRFWAERCRLIAPNSIVTPELFRANAASDVRIRDCLLVGFSPNSLINNVSTILTSLDASARAISISREKVILTDDEEGVKLKWGAYEPGDMVFSGIAHPGSAKQPRRYIAVGDRIVGTSNGNARMTDWAVLATPTSHLRSVCFNEGGSGTCFLACGDNGLIMRSNSAGEGWAVVGAGVTTQRLRAIWAKDAAGTVVAVGDNGTVLRSTDGGATWAAAATPGTTRNLYGVASNRAGTLWVACGAEGRVITSTDGSTWTEQTQGSTTWRAAYRVNDATFMIGGDSGELRTSPDGATWTTRTTNTINSIRGFGWNGGGNVVAIARQTYERNDGTTAQLNFTDTFLNTSDSGATWTIDEQTVPLELNAITGGLNPMESFGAGNDFIYVNNYFVAVGEAQTVCLRMLKTWKHHRILTSANIDRAETFEKWLGRAQ